MTRVPSEPPHSTELTAVADRLAGTIRRHVLAAAQASLRAIREILAQLPVAEGQAGRPAKIEPPSPRVPAADARAAAVSPTTSRPRPGTLSNPPSAELLRADATLPVSYGSDRVVLLARDPHCLYAYWDLSDSHAQQVRTHADSPQLRIVLRAYDVTQISFDAKPPTRFQDFAVAGDARSVYAYVGKPAACFVAEVGYLRPDGVFFPLARSQPVWTPRTDQPGVAPARWMTVGWSERTDAGEVVPLTTTGTGTLEVDPMDPPTPSLHAPSSWPGAAPSEAQRGSWSLVRGTLTTAASPASRSEP